MTKASGTIPVLARTSGNVGTVPAAVAAAGAALRVVGRGHDVEARHRIGVPGLTGLHGGGVPGEDLAVRRMRQRQPRRMRLRERTVEIGRASCRERV